MSEATLMKQGRSSLCGKMHNLISFKGKKLFFIHTGSRVKIKSSVCEVYFE